MSCEKSISKQVNEFNKMIMDLENINVHINNEDKPLLLLCLVSKTRDHFKETLLYARDVVSLKEVQLTL